MTQAQAPHTISLQELGKKYFQGLQHLSDLTAYNWAGSRSVSEQGYDELVRGFPGLPATEFRLPFETAKAEMERAWLKQSISEAIGLSYVFIEDMRRLGALVTFNAAKASGSGDLAALAADVNSVTPPTDLVTRLNEVRERYGIKTEVDEEMISLSKVARSLLHHNGVLGPEDEPVELKLKMITPPATEKGQPQLGDFSASWKPGERIILNRQQHAAVYTTISLFFGYMLNAVQDYAQRAGVGQQPAQ